MKSPTSPNLTPDSVCFRYRLRFGKGGDLRFLSHHDLMRLFERMLRRAAVPMATSQGFNPRPKVVFAHALGLGVASEAEVVDLELAAELPCEELRERLTAQAPAGLPILSVERRATHRAPQPRVAHYTMNLPGGRREAAREALDQFLASPRFPIQKTRGERTRELDLRALVPYVELDPDGRLRFALRHAAEGAARPEDLLLALELRDLLDAGIVITRARLDLDDDHTPASGDAGPDPTSQADEPAPLATRS